MRTRAYKRKGAAGPAPGVTERFIGFKAVWLQPPGSTKHRLTVCFRRPVHEGTVLATRVIDNPVPYSVLPGKVPSGLLKDSALFLGA